MFRALLGVLLLGVPLVVIAALPRVLEFAGSIGGAPAGAARASSPAANATPTVARARGGSLAATPPPTLTAPLASAGAIAIAAASPSPTGERVVVANTDGRGAVLRTEPVTGRPVAALHEQQVLDVLEHRNVPGSGDWLRVRAADGVEGWVTGLAARPAVGSRP